MTTTNTDSPYLTVAEVADVLRVSRMTVYRMTRDGTLPAIHVGRQVRIRADHLHTYIHRDDG